ncbi:MAG: hypothetical protein ACXWEW_02635 [Nitrososphaeraceae archaeon]
MAANNPEAVLIVGDFSYKGNAKQWWSKIWMLLTVSMLLEPCVTMMNQMMFSLNNGHSMEVNENLFTS